MWWRHMAFSIVELGSLRNYECNKLNNCSFLFIFKIIGFWIFSQTTHIVKMQCELLNKKNQQGWKQPC